MDQGPTSTNQNVHGAKALFWYLSLFFTLGLTASGVGALWFQFINKLVPLEVTSVVQQSFSQGAIKYGIATLIIAAPLFFLFSYLTRKAINKGNLDPDNKVKVWITYIILFITVAIAVGDLITTVFRVLDGDFTTRFILKSLAILVIVGYIFTYYWLELRSEKALAKEMAPKIFGGVALAVMIVSFAASFTVIDSPATARAKAFDLTRENHLYELQNAVNNYYTQNQALPESLEDLENSRYFVSTKDPKTGERYGYSITGEDSFEICMSFETASMDDQTVYGPYGTTRLKHDIGEECLEYRISEEFPGAVKPIPVPRVIE